LYGVTRKSADLLRTLSVIAALAASVVVLGATMTPAQATLPGKNGKIAFTQTFHNFVHEGEGIEVTSDIYTVNPDGTNLTNLTADTSTSGSEGGPAWSPDGAKIAFASNLHEYDTYEDRRLTLAREANNYDIYVIDANGRNPKRLTHTPVTNWDPDWQPLPGPTEATPEKQQEQRQQNQQQQPSQHGSKSRSLTVHPPDTGGPSLLLVASALFISGGTLLYAVVRRRM
jgi:WD40-like Beta Propeller Repeat